MRVSAVGLAEVMGEQHQLTELCEDRPLETAEIFAANAYYGIDRILKEYAGLAWDYPLKVVVPHGPYLSEQVLWEAERGARLPAVLAYPAYRGRVYARTTSKLVIPSASPYLYLQRLLQNQRKPSRSGTIFFPSHSTHEVTVSGDFMALASRLKGLPECFQPVTVCMYWKDVLLGHHLIFENAGLRVVSAGHIHDPRFLARFHHLCSTHIYAAGNHVGSHLFYSVVSGCSYFHLGDQQFSYDAPPDVLGREFLPDGEEAERRLAWMFIQPMPRMNEQQLAAVACYLGADSVRPAHELRRQLLECEQRDRTGVVVRNTGYRPRLILPTYYQRRLGGLVRRLRG